MPISNPYRARRRIRGDNPTNRAAPSLDGCVSRWTVLDDPAWRNGGTWRDNVGVNDGTLTNGPTWSDGAPPGGYGSLLFNGVGYCDLAFVNTTLTTNFSIFLWVRHPAVPANFKVYFTSGTAANNWYLQYYNTSKFAFTEPGINDYLSTGTVTLDGWMHIGVVKNGDGASNLQLFINGILDSTHSVGTVSTPSGSSSIGARGGGQIFTGSLDNLAIYNRALSASEVADLYDRSLFGDPLSYNWLAPRGADAAVDAPPSWFDPEMRMEPWLDHAMVLDGWFDREVIPTPVAGPVTVTPATGTLTLTTFAPTIKTPRTVVPSTATLLTTTFAPDIKISIIVTPPTKTLTITSFAPSILTPRVIIPPTKSLILTSFAPTISTPKIVIPPTTALVTTAFAPTIVLPRVVKPPVASFILTGFAPIILTPRVVQPGVKALLLSSFAPTVLTPRVVSPLHRSFSLTAFAPIIQTPRIVLPSTASLLLTSFAPAIKTHIIIRPPISSLILTGYAPVILTGGGGSSPRFHRSAYLRSGSRGSPF